MNWKLSGADIEFDHGLSILSNIETDKGLDSNFLPVEYKKSGKWSYYTTKEMIAQAKVLEDAHTKFLSAYNHLLMINPTKEKFATTTRDLTFYELLRMYSNQLEKENSVLFVCIPPTNYTHHLI